MVQTCLNRDCSVPFRYANKGKLFVFHGGKKEAASALFQHVYWLCPKCAPRFRVELRRGVATLLPLARAA